MGIIQLLNYSTQRLNMKLFIVLCLVAVAFAKHSPLTDVLQSPSATAKLYKEFKNQEHLNFNSLEDQLRFRIFRSTAKMVAAENEKDEETAEFALNFFSAMTPNEKSSYLGLNVTGHTMNALPALSSSGVGAPVEKLWTSEGKVTAVKNQGGCGSCWTFGAIGGLETRYASVSGKLRNFAEQEWLDCVYPSRDGCQGGWPSDCYDYSKANGGRLASAAHYTYVQSDGSCKSASKPDDMISAKISGYQSVGASEAANIEALATGALSVAFEVTNKFQQYSSGIIRDTTCTGRPNHAVTAVGYTANFVLVKNSWGATWGDSGFVKFSRNYGNCGLFDYSSYPLLSNTGATDSTPSDAAAHYDPGNDDGPAPTSAPDCFDDFGAANCASYVNKGYCAYDWFVEDYCMESCGGCTSGDCPSGTIKCDDGVCRHEHMC